MNTHTWFKTLRFFSCIGALWLISCTAHVQYEVRPGSALQALGITTEKISLPKIDFGGDAIPATYIDGQQTILLREYHLRSGTSPSVNQIIRNVNSSNVITPTPLKSALRTLTEARGDGFKERDASEAVLAASNRYLITGEPLQRVAFWHPVTIKPYDFQRKKFDICLSRDCVRLPNGELRITLDARDYFLALGNVPQVIELAPPNEKQAREIEAGAAMQSFPRGMDALLIVDLLPQVGSNGAIRSELAGIAFYQRTSFTEARALPSSSRGILVYWMSPESPYGNKSVSSSTVASMDQLSKADTSNKIQVPERDFIQKYLELTPSKKNPGYFESNDDCGSVDLIKKPFDLKVKGLNAVLALVQDGPDSMCFGSSGGRIVIFLEDEKSRHYRPILDIGGSQTPALEQRGRTMMPDLIFRNTACNGVWRWNGKQYQHHSNVATRPGGCQSRAF